MNPAAEASIEPKLHVDKFADGEITCLKLAGTIDEGFDGKRLAGTVRGGTLVLDLGEVKKISSFGIREWVDFVGAAGDRVGTLVFVECAPKIVDQLNMVLNFAGKGRVFSFYAPYRCDYCDVDKRVLLQVDRDHEAIRAMKPPERPCESCGNPAYFDEDPATFFSYLAQQPPFELEPEVAAFLATRLNYAVEGPARRFRAEKQIAGRATYVHLSGDLDATFPTVKVAEGLEGVVVVDLSGVGKIDPAGAAAWRGFIASISTTCEQVWLVGCPPAFLERLARAEDLARAQVVSFSMPYTCASCAATAAHTIDVEEHFAVLKFATPPDVICPDCGGPARCGASETLLAHLGALSRPEVPAELRAFIATAQSRKALAQRPPTAAPAPAGRGLGTVLIASAAAAVVAVAVVYGWTWWRARNAQIAGEPVGPVVARSAPARPAWITADARAFGRCGDAAQGVSCLGVSSYAATAEEARGQAIDAALEALVERAGAGVTDPEWKRLVAALYVPARQRGLERADGKPALAGRHAVVEALRRTAASVPAQPAAEYWERFEGGRTLAFARFDVAAGEIEALRARFTAPSEALGARAITVFPGLAWRDDALRGGAEIVALGPGPLRDAGLAPQDMVVEVEGRPVADAASFAAASTAADERLAQTGGALKLTVKSGDAPPRAFSVAVARKTPKAAPERPEPSAPRPIGGTGGVNIWDKTGGGRDDPNQ